VTSVVPRKYIKSLRFQKTTLPYSYRKYSTGFLVAARQLCQLTVRSATTSAIKTDNANTHQLSPVLSAKLSSHRCMKYQASQTFAPFTFRIPISLVLFWAVNTPKPNIPSIEMDMARNAITVSKDRVRISFS